MSQEVSLNGRDYGVILSWFDRLFADGERDSTTMDTKTYQKLCVMAWAYTDEIDFLQDAKRKDRDQDDDFRGLGR